QSRSNWRIRSSCPGSLGPGSEGSMSGISNHSQAEVGREPDPPLSPGSIVPLLHPRLTPESASAQLDEVREYRIVVQILREPAGDTFATDRVPRVGPVLALPGAGWPEIPPATRRSDRAEAKTRIHRLKPQLTPRHGVPPSNHARSKRLMGSNRTYGRMCCQGRSSPGVRSATGQ